MYGILPIPVSFSCFIKKFKFTDKAAHMLYLPYFDVKSHLRPWIQSVEEEGFDLFTAMH